MMSTGLNHIWLVIRCNLSFIPEKKCAVSGCGALPAFTFAWTLDMHRKKNVAEFQISNRGGQIEMKEDNQ